MSETGRSEAESALFEFLGLQKGGVAGDFEAFAAGRPHIADELRRLWASWQQLEPLLHTLFGEGADVSLSGLLDGLGVTDGPPLPSILPTLSLRVADGTPRGEQVSPARIVERLASKAGAHERYEAQDLVGRGGMGEIHRVWDEDLHRQLAMKVMLARDPQPQDPETETRRELALARFLDEALITAQLDHPGIVPVHDLGIDDQGRVYFTMKLVKGRHLKRIIELVHAGEEGWTLNRVVGVILRVCEAVAYAHSKGVLHRDIKPANIMVGRFGETYLMDWGLARLLGAATENGPPAVERPVTVPPDAEGDDAESDDSWLFTEDAGILGTPSYMSPEQARGEVDAVDERSDVYSLGALLYHLISGRTPYLEPGEIPLPFSLLMKVRRGPPTPLDELAPEAPPTLAAICARAMARNVDQRYASAADMAAELEDYLEDISEAREDARREARRAELINRFLMDTLSFGAPERALGREITVREVLDRAAARIEDALPDHPLDEAALRATIGNLYRKLGQFVEAEPHLERARTLLRSALGPEHPQSLTATVDLAVLRRQTGHLDEAEALLRPTLALSRRVLGVQHPDTLRCAYNIALVLHRNGVRLEEAEQMLRECMAGREAVLGHDHGDTLECATSLALVLQDAGRPEEAVQLQRATLARLRRVLGERNPDTLMARKNLAGMLQALGEYPEAESIYRELVVAEREVYGESHPETLLSLNNYGTLLRRCGRHDEARPLLEEALATQRELHGNDHPNTLGFMHNLALLELALGRLESAEALFRESVERSLATLGPEHRYTGRFRHNLGLCLHAQGRHDEARSEWTAALQALSAALDDDHEWVRDAARALESCD